MRKKAFEMSLYLIWITSTDYLDCAHLHNNVSMTDTAANANMTTHLFTEHLKPIFKLFK